jgi:hypothetical protein
VTRQRWQSALFVIALVFAGAALARQWDAVRIAATAQTVRWVPIAVATAIVLGTYALLIWTWRWLLHHDARALSFLDAVRIWTIANLGRYLPGKVWSVGALGALAMERGVSALSAAAAAIASTVINVVAGFGVLSFFGGTLARALSPAWRSASIAVAAGGAIGIACVPWLLKYVAPRIAPTRIARNALPSFSALRLTVATAANVTSWMLYGVAFWCFAHGVRPDTHVKWTVAVVVWTASYLSGYLAFIVPGGIGVREGAMVAALVAVAGMGAAEATWLAVSSRVWLTILEIVPGTIFWLTGAGRVRGAPRSVG